MRQVIALAIMAFAVTVGAMVGMRLTSEALAVVVGVVCGVLASIPTSILLLIVSRRQASGSPAPSRQPQPTYPPVIVINPNASPPDRPSYPLFEPPDGRPAGYLPRQFRIIGGEEEEDEF